VIERDKIPSTTQSLTQQDLDPSKAPTVPDALMRTVPSVFIGDTAVNPFQPDIQFRGFVASPTVGTPQGLAIYQNGVRINESFGDTVNWDFIPERAIRRLDLFPSNPIFGLNAIGGAISLEMKNGFNYNGREIEAIVGSFGRRSVGAQFGAQKDNVAFYAAADAINDNGWRQRSASELRRIYTDVGVRGDDTEFHLNFTGASNRFGALASTPIEMLNRSWSSIYTSPQTYKNQLAFLNATGSYRVSDTWTVKGNAYIRSFRQQHVDGNVSDAQPCVPGPGLCFDDPTTPLLDQNGVQVPNILGGGIAGSIDRTRTVAETIGGTVQAASSDKLFGRDNQFVVGASLDHGNVRFNASSELGTIGSDLFVTGTGSGRSQDPQHLLRLLCHRHHRPDLQAFAHGRRTLQPGADQASGSARRRSQWQPSILALQSGDWRDLQVDAEYDRLCGLFGGQPGTDAVGACLRGSSAAMSARQFSGRGPAAEAGGLAHLRGWHSRTGAAWQDRSLQLELRRVHQRFGR
jgi:iron complex outermembrane receptor protein